MGKVRWGILSAARIGVDKVIPGMRKSPRCHIAALASQTPGRAEAAAAALGIPKAYASYEALLADPDIDAVYNPLPNHLHVPWSIRALEAGKHVLCEKPIGMSAAEGRLLVAAGRRHPSRKLMEAFMYRHHAQWRQAKEWTLEGRIGELRTIGTLFSYFNDDPGDIRNQPATGGGALFDIGCYPISLSRFLFDAEPQRVFGIVEIDPRFGVDRLASAVLDFGRGTSTFTCSTQLAPYQRVQVMGTAGRIEIEIPFNAPPDRPCILQWQTAAGTETVSMPLCDQYERQGDLFARAILDD